MSRSFGHSCSHKQLWSKKGVWVCVMEDYRAQEMDQEGGPPLVKHEQHFLLLWGTEISFLFLIFFPWTHKVETGRSWKHTESGCRHLAQSGLKTGWNIQRLCQPSRNCVILKIAIIKYIHIVVSVMWYYFENTAWCRHQRERCMSFFFLNWYITITTKLVAQNNICLLSHTFCRSEILSLHRWRSSGQALTTMKSRCLRGYVLIWRSGSVSNSSRSLAEFSSCGCRTKVPPSC